MDDLMIFERKKQAVVGSRTIAQRFGKIHRDTVRAIENLIAQNCAVKTMFHESRFVVRGREYTEYLMNRDGFSLLVMGFTGKEALAWKLKYIEAFNRMERLLLEKQTAEWQAARQQGKQIRLQETDAIKALVDYAKAQGSQNSDKLYLTYSKLIKSLAEYETRDTARTDTLVMVATFEHLLAGIITQEMTLNTHYKAIYQRAKAQLNELRQLWLIPKPLPLEKAK